MLQLALNHPLGVQMVFLNASLAVGETIGPLVPSCARLVRSRAESSVLECFGIFADEALKIGAPLRIAGFEEGLREKFQYAALRFHCRSVVDQPGLYRRCGFNEMLCFGGSVEFGYPRRINVELIPEQTADR